MIDRLGRDWFNQRCAGGNFLHEGKILWVKAAVGDIVLAFDKENRQHKIPCDFFSGFKVFEYPALGYRAFNGDLAVYYTKFHSYNRGLRPRCVKRTLSPVTEMFLEKWGPALGVYAPTDNEAMEHIFQPVYAKPADVGAVIRGERVSAVLNADVLVEANTAGKNAEGFAVYFRGRPCANINEDTLEIHWFTQEYKNFLQQIVRPMGAW